MSPARKRRGTGTGRRWRPALLCIGMLLAGASAAFPPPAAAQGGEAEKSAQLAQVRERIEALKRELEADRDRHSGLRAELEESERAMARVTRRLAALEAEQSGARERLAALTRSRDERRVELAQEREALAGLLRSGHRAGRAEYLKLLLNQEDPQRLGRMLVYYDYLGRARTARLERLRLALEGLATAESEVRAAADGLDAVRAEVRREQAALAGRQRERSRVLTALGHEIGAKDRQLKTLVEDEERLQRVLATLRRALAELPGDYDAGKPFPTQRGHLPWPASGSVKAVFGASRGVGELKWSGILIAAPEGRAVHAVHRGRVAFADWLRGFGLLMIVDHGDGYMSLYGHNQHLLKEVGEWVEAGEAVASVGASGGRTAAGLYFEIRHNGRPVDPIRWLARR
ncbi:MAG: peptidoglycan DD-metalloendopeptidase family protein [Gammaproteobacteria bacterium]|nr:peptidoglycan DD-metalloendopeptidase family protein [Gammaproteobacteria bacterium]